MVSSLDTSVRFELTLNAPKAFVLPLHYEAFVFYSAIEPSSEIGAVIGLGVSLA